MSDWSEIPTGGDVCVLDRGCLPDGVLPDGCDFLLVRERAEDDSDDIAIAVVDLGALRVLVASLNPSSITLARAIANPEAVVASLRDLETTTH